ncbi:hypothetical protein PITCH_A470006 [uncultured Desulfobacterium sp.]|uniref:Uncharacterized protein n=1 Tax=uncultured Desulfobacterium sp. TaxID=201089 RepID=A0A445N0C9_9BACT|nr:hypothetical protein PITCH_A470006 [uncultured Desulfobacterium sp.]
MDRPGPKLSCYVSSFSELRVTSYGLRVAGYELHVAGFESASYRLRVFYLMQDKDYAAFSSGHA